MAALPRLSSSRASGSVSTSELSDCCAALPSSISAVRAAVANGTMLENCWPTAFALWPSEVISGVPCSAS